MLHEIFEASGQAKVLSTLDLRSGYHQLPLHDCDKQKTAFWGIDEHGKYRIYQWKFLPFGLKNVIVEFQRVMDKVLVGVDFVKCYINDIIVFSKNCKEHKKHL